MKVRVFDVFTGIAGFSLGLDRALGDNIVHVGFGDIKQSAIDVCRYRYPDVVNYKDGDPIPNFDLLVGGSPCQDFSIAGKRAGLEGQKSSLFYYFLNLLVEYKPQNFMFENVKGLLSSKKGADFKAIVWLFKQAGYSIDYAVLNSKDFGVPQNRERVYVVGSRNKEVNIFPIKNSFLPTKVGDILLPKVDNKYTISDRLWDGHQRRKAEHGRRGNGFGYSIFDENSGYTSTISGRYYKDGSEILISQPGKNPRKITPIEGERLHSFPDDWTRFGVNEKGLTYELSDSKRYELLGNSVTVNIVEQIAKKLYGDH